MKEFADDIELRARAIADPQRPCVRQHRQRVRAPLFPPRVNFVGFTELNEMPQRPGHEVAATFQIALVSLLRSQYGRDVSGYRGFFGEHGDRHGRPANDGGV